MICGSEKLCRAIKKKRENICLADNLPRLQAMIDGVILATLCTTETTFWSRCDTETETQIGR